VNGGEIFCDLVGTVPAARFGHDPGLDGLGFDPAVTPHANLGHPLARGLLRRWRRQNALSHDDIETNDDPVGPALGLDLGVGHLGHGAQHGQVIVNDSGVVTRPSLGLKQRAEILQCFGRPDDLDFRHVGGLCSDDLIENLIGQFVDALQQLVVSPGGEHEGMRSQTDGGGRHANVETEMAREFRETPAHDCVGPDPRRNPAQIRIRSLATRVARQGDVDHSDLSARLESRAVQIGDRFSEVVDGLRTVDPKGKHHDGVPRLDSGRDSGHGSHKHGRAKR